MEIKYCAKCQKRVSSVDISDGMGVKFGGKYYCEECVVKYKIREQLNAAVKRVKAETGATMPVQPVPEPAPEKQKQPASAEEAPKPAAEPEPAAEPAPDQPSAPESEPEPSPAPQASEQKEKPASRWKPIPAGTDFADPGADTGERTKRKKKNLMPLIITITGVIILIAIGAAIMMKSSSGGGTRKKKGRTQTPWSGTPLQVPGKIEAEHYDKGGSGIAFSDSDMMNQGKFVGIKFRQEEGVDLAKCLDGGGGIAISLIEKGEWVEYTINVPETGDYDLILRVNSAGFDIIVNPYIDGKALLKNPKAWRGIPDREAWVSAPIEKLHIEKGEHVLRLVFGSLGWSLNWIEIKKSE